METYRHQRIVKRAPLLKRIANAPEDYLMRVQNNIQALDWDMLQEGFSWPLAVSLNLLLMSVKLGYWFDDPMANVPAVLRTGGSSYHGKSLRPGFAALLASLQYILVAISILNAMWLFRSKKNYKLLHRNTMEKPNSSSVRMVEFQQDETHWSFRFPGKYIYPYVSYFFKGPAVERQSRQVWEMSLWNPAILSRNLFCWFSPAQVLIMAGMDENNFHIFFPISIMVGLQVHFLVSVYQAYVKDKQILFGEVYREYNNNFVHPRIFVRKYDQSVSTETDMYDLHDQDDSFEYEPRQLDFGSRMSTPIKRASLLDRYSSMTSTSTSISSRSSSPTRQYEDEEDEEDEGDDDEIEVDEDEEEYSSGEEQDLEDEDEDEEEEDEDQDVEYDEEGETPLRPHPTNALDLDD